MVRKILTGSLIALFVLATAAVQTTAQQIVQEPDDADTYGLARIDRFLDCEVWTDHYDGEYYVGDNINIHFRASADAFVAIYSIDTRGRVNLLFPSTPTEDNFVRGGVTYRLPAEGADYDLEITGPEGFENLQIIASRERFPIPNWYVNSGLICDWDDRAEFMDYLNTEYFVKYGGQRFAYDRAAIYVNEWEEYYYRPIYRPYYPSWTVCGNVYIDYPWGATIYVNGIYWGCAPLYIPRIAIGWHTVTIYDRWGYCWESDFHVSRYNTVVFNQTIVNTSPGVRSKYKEVREVGYRDPINHGYPKFRGSEVVSGGVVAPKGSGPVVKTREAGVAKGGGSGEIVNLPKKYTRGSTNVVKTDRGLESDISGAVFSGDQAKTRPGSTSRGGASYGRKMKSTEKAVTPDVGEYGSTRGTTRSSGGSYEGSTSRRGTTGSRGSSSGDYYQRKSGSSSTSRGGRKTTESNRQQPSVEDGGSKSDNSRTRREPPSNSGSSSGGSSSGTYERGSSSSSDKGRSSGSYSPPSRSGESSGRSSGSSSRGSSGGSYRPANPPSGGSSGGSSSGSSRGGSSDRSGSSDKSKSGGSSKRR